MTSVLRMRRLAAVVPVVVAVALTSTLTAPASTLEKIEKKKERLEKRLAGTEQDLSGTESQIGESEQQVNQSTKALDRATRAFQQAQAQIPGAQAALTLAQENAAQAQSALAAAQAESARAASELAAAQAAEAAAVEELRLAEKRVAKANRKVKRLGDRIQSERDVIGQVAAQAYQQGSIGGLEALVLVLDAEDVDDFNARITYVQSAINAGGQVLAGLQDTRAAQANARVQLEEAEAAAEQARAAAQLARESAAAVLAASQAAEAAAQEAAVVAATMEQQAAAAAQQVQTLVVQRDRARVDAEKAKAADVAAYRELEEERARIETEIIALAAQVRQQETAAKAERQRIEEERRRAEEERRRAEEEARRRAAAEAAGEEYVPELTAPVPSGPLLRPVDGPITSIYGMRLHPVLGYWKLHDGSDFGAGCGTPIRASESGSVVWSQYRGGYGNQVLISHGMVGGVPLMTSYSHLSTLAASPGQWVSEGQVIGYVGSTGYSTGCHLHWMVYADGKAVDPMSYL